MLDTTERPCTDKITEPSKQWRNKYQALASYFGSSISTGEEVFREIGDVFWGPRAWPSKEIAEQKAHELSLIPTTAMTRGLVEYLGAFPVTA